MKAWNKFLNWIYPPTCPLCGEVTGGQTSQVCDTCRPMIAYPEQPVCLKCGCEIADMEQELCEDCTRHVKSYIQGFPAMKYQYPLDESLARFKYHNQKEYADFYAGQIVKRHGQALISLSLDAVIPIPIHKRKMAKRGYNQAELLADALGTILDIQVERDFLMRVVNTEPQKSLNPKQREENLKRAFQCTEKSVSYKRVLLVDDIYTTGATIEACTKKLHASGIPDVYYASAAIGTGR